MAAPGLASRPKRAAHTCAPFCFPLLPLPLDPMRQPPPATVSSSSPRRHRLRPSLDQNDRRRPRVTRITWPCPLGATPTQPPRHPPAPAIPSDAIGASSAVRPVRHGWSSDLGAIKRRLERPRDSSAHDTAARWPNCPHRTKRRGPRRKFGRGEASRGLGDVDYQSSERRPERLPRRHASPPHHHRTLPSTTR